MYFWNINALVERLRSGSLSEKQKMIYLLCYLCIVIFHTSFGEFPTIAEKIGGFFIAIAFQAIIAVVCFRTNSAGDGRNFLERYVCLQVPLTIRYWVIVFPALYLVGIVGGILKMPESVFLIVLLFVSLGFLWTYISYLKKFIAKVAAQPDEAAMTGGPSATA